ncbi:MAG: hypothetical protein LUC22_04615 [Prevotella sp.]|nr:hypothetical protein [Prevotella sp.]
MDGTLFEEKNFKDSRHDGYTRVWHDGRLREKVFYTDDGKRRIVRIRDENENERRWETGRPSIQQELVEMVRTKK